MLGILIGLVLLMFLAYRGYSIIWVAPVAAAVVAVIGGLPLLGAYKDTYMIGFADFVKAWFPVFMLGAVFGNLMEFTGFAGSIASGMAKVLGKKRAILAVILGCAVLTYGGISLFVVVFAMYPVALALFKEANITVKLIPGCIALGSFTFTMTALPGSPQIQNLIPTTYFNTTATAAPIMGITAALFMFGSGYIYLIRKEKRLTARGEIYIEPKNKKDAISENKSLPNPFLSILPPMVVIIVLNILELNIIIALLSGITLCMLLRIKSYKGFTKSIGTGASGSVIAIINTSAAVGFGAVVRAVPGFKTLTDFVLGIKGSPLISEAVAVNLLSGATGSASGGLGIALAALGEKYYQLALETGVSPEAFHRIASLASGGLDTLPHNGAVLTLLAITGLTHKDSYVDIAITSLVLPVLSSIPAILLAGLGIY